MTNPTDAVAAGDLRTQLVELQAERDALRAQLEGDLPTATRWLQRKVWRQAAALDALNRRVVTQRALKRPAAGSTPAWGTDGRPAPASRSAAPDDILTVAGCP
jgi:hypothetical protein